MTTLEVWSKNLKYNFFSILQNSEKKKYLAHLLGDSLSSVLSSEKCVSSNSHPAHSKRAQHRMNHIIYVIQQITTFYASLQIFCVCQGPTAKLCKNSRNRTAIDNMRAFKRFKAERGTNGYSRVQQRVSRPCRLSLAHIDGTDYSQKIHII